MNKLIGTVHRWVKPIMYLVSVLVFIVVGVFLLGELLPHFGRVGWAGVLATYAFVVVLLYWALRLTYLSIEGYRELLRRR